MGYCPVSRRVSATHKPALDLIGNDITGAINITVQDFFVWAESNTSVI